MRAGDAAELARLVAIGIDGEGVERLPASGTSSIVQEGEPRAAATPGPRRR
jgi:hypothetical protein